MFLKYELCLESMAFLWRVVPKDGIIVDSSKIKVVHGWSRLISITKIRNFVNLARYYKRVIERFYTIATPLTRLNHRGIPFVWSIEGEFSFMRLKKLLFTTPILALLVEGKDFTI